jgi:hypothetical protein
MANGAREWSNVMATTGDLVEQSLVGEAQRGGVQFLVVGEQLSGTVHPAVGLLDLWLEGSSCLQATREQPAQARKL